MSNNLTTINEFTSDGIFNPHLAIGIDFGSTPLKKKAEVYTVGIGRSNCRFVSLVFLEALNPQVRNQLARDDGNDSS